MQHFRNDGLALNSRQVGPISTTMAQRWGEYIIYLTVNACKLTFLFAATTVLARVSMREKMEFSPQFLRHHISSDDQYKMSCLALS